MPVFEPQISWKGDIPVSETSHDIYFSTSGGFEETTHVFIDGNNLLQRWTENGENQSSKITSGHFTILETGFGTGLNFVSACYYFLKSNAKNLRLHFISIEKFPLSKNDIQRALSVYISENPGFDEIIKQILPAYPPRLCGTHRLNLFNGKICLTLVFDDIITALDNLQIPSGVDAFFLDGFNPASNPEMWSEKVIQKISAFAREGSTLATFTAAGFVRRNIESAGFHVTKLPGFGKKREMITARKTQTTFRENIKPWFNHAEFHYNNKKEVAIIGSGLAGCSLASSFLRRGWQVTVIDENNSICSGASGNPFGIFFPVVHKKPTFADRFSRASYLYTLNLLQNYNDVDMKKFQTGLMQILNETECRLRFGDYQGDHGSLEKIFSISEKFQPGKSNVWYTGAGYISPEDFSSVNLKAAGSVSDSSRLEFIHGIKVKSLHQQGDDWQLYDESGKPIMKTGMLILANSFGITEFDQTNWLPVTKIRGQLVWTKNILHDIDFPVSGEVYVIPSKEGTIVGATHDFSDDERISQAQGRQLLEKASGLFSSSSGWLEFFRSAIEKMNSENFKIANWNENPVGWDGWAGRVSFRSAASDHFPVIGPVPHKEKYLETFSDLSHGELDYFRKNGRGPKPDAWHKNLFCLTGLGSRGIIYSQLGSEIIASMVCGEPSPVETDILAALAPSRFLYRKIKTSKLK